MQASAEGLGQEGSDVNMGATIAARTWAGSSTPKHLTLDIGVSGWHSVYRMPLLFLGVTRLYSAEDKYQIKQEHSCFPIFLPHLLFVPPGCGLRGQEVIAECQPCTPRAAPGHSPQPNRPSWQRFLAEITSQGSPVPHLTTTSGARSQ